MEHILGTLKNADTMIKRYPFLNKTGMIFGTIFHDIGEVLDYRFDSKANDYITTNHRRLIGHCGGAIEILKPYFSKYNISMDLQEYLFQIIGSHMGNEMASISEMCTPETICLNFADHMDALADSMQRAKDKYLQGKTNKITVANSCLYFYE
ncbi:HD domain-containing protein [Ruminiclostridium papyrosolvens]|uniref:HD domain-containing protein n=1 Tax=Ruminiclostridium papyrosolvens C7 TaxID=1330534 RepID=U4R0R4_9FIRM|nr:HD domain-containing protein [Ruminiclostridium papyrosolvens]EPR11500.1 hypothetical protein L323_11900 [Ruminiclostridium papyrosolvens C7]